MTSSVPDATDQAELVRGGQASPAELVDEAIARIERLDPELNAVIMPLFDKARAAAAGDLPNGPFGDPMYEGMGFLREVGWGEGDDTEFVKRFRGRASCSWAKSREPTQSHEILELRAACDAARGKGLQS